MKLKKLDSMCAITKRVIDDFSRLTDTEFLYKYACHKATYLKRVKKYGDPYMNAPLAKLGRFLATHVRR